MLSNSQTQFKLYRHRNLYQIEDAITNKKVTVEEHIDGTMKIIHNGKSVKFRKIQQRPEVKLKEPKIKRRKATNYIPSQDHPWRKIYKKSVAKTNNPPLEVAA